jgi:hypothetical protein
VRIAFSLCPFRSGLHNFCVGEIKLLVHNASGTGDFLDRLQQANRQFGQNKRFRNWFHKVWKQDQGIPGGGRNNPDLPPESILEAYEEWLSQGQPGA